MPEETPVETPIEPSAPAPEAAPVAVEAPPSAPETAPAPSGAPSAPEDERSVPPGDMWKAILDQSGGPFKASPDPLAAEPAPPSPRPVRVRSEVVAPAPPKQWAGRFDTPEAMEAAYQEADQARQRAETERQRAQAQSERMERLLLAASQRTGAAPEQPKADPPTQQELSRALERVRKESELLALGDPQGDPLQLVRAVAAASRLDEEARRHYADLALREMSSHNQATQQIQGIQDEFFRQYPDLKGARPSLLRLVAVEVETRLKQSRDDYGSTAYIQEWFNETAKEARASIRIGDGKAPIPASGTPAKPAAISATPRPARGAPFSESPTPRSAEPALTGQDAHLARVFGGRQ